jgi:hypothetical protein
MARARSVRCVGVRLRVESFPEVSSARVERRTSRNGNERRIVNREGRFAARP